MFESFPCGLPSKVALYTDRNNPWSPLDLRVLRSASFLEDAPLDAPAPQPHDHPARGLGQEVDLRHDPIGPTVRDHKGQAIHDDVACDSAEHAIYEWHPESQMHRVSKRPPMPHGRRILDDTTTWRGPAGATCLPQSLPASEPYVAEVRLTSVRHNPRVASVRIPHLCILRFAAPPRATWNDDVQPMARSHSRHVDATYGGATSLAQFSSELVLQPPSSRFRPPPGATRRPASLPTHAP